MKVSSAILNILKRKPKRPPSVSTIFRNKKTWSKLSVKDLDLLEGKNVGDLLKKYPLSPSKTKALDKMIVDYKKGNLSLSGSTTSKYKNKKLNKEKLEKIIADYEDAKKKKRNSISLRIIDKFKELDLAALKRKFSWTSSREKLFNEMVEDYKEKKISLSKLKNRSKFDPEHMSKEEINEILKSYRAVKKNKSTSMTSKTSKLSALLKPLANKRLSQLSIPDYLKQYM